MYFKRPYRRTFIKKASYGSRRYSPYVRKGVRGRVGVRSYGGYKRTNFIKRFRGGPSFVAKSSYGRVAKRPVHRRFHAPSLSSRAKLRLATALAPSGTLTFSSLSSRYDWSTGTQGCQNAGSSYPSISFISDLNSIVAAAIARTTAEVSAATPVVEPKFWIRSASSRTIVVNTGQIACDVFFYPMTSRYSTSYAGYLDLANTDALEGKAASTGSVVGNAAIVGWNPFQSRSITENFIIGKPKRVHLEGGMSFTYTMKDSRPMYLNYARLVPDVGTSIQYAVPRRTKVCMILARSNPVNSSSTMTDINWGFGALDVQEIRSYEWVASPMPNHYNDIYQDATEILNAAIIQPQTGAINLTPSVI